MATYTQLMRKSANYELLSSRLSDFLGSLNAIAGAKIEPLISAYMHSYE